MSTKQPVNRRARHILGCSVYGCTSSMALDIAQATLEYRQTAQTPDKIVLTVK